MKKNLPYSSTSACTVKHLPLYKKALDIYALSRKLTDYLSHNASLQSLYQSSSQEDQILEEMVVIALALPPKVAIAQTTKNATVRLHSLKSIALITAKIRSHCKFLRTSSRRNTDYIQVMLKKIDKFNKMHQQWSILLTQQN